MSFEKKWIWQRETYPNFEYNQTKLDPILQEIKSVDIVTDIQIIICETYFNVPHSKEILIKNHI
ncbi:MAG: Unknown protein [uncultured Sulfurovum sp.]|uniref:DUF4172 domain-containing protein n=1 Tax=uncultured Sulfurovum sp. TaxID=269237 RepID=A0A6S6U964_9BACT|nr:MAG: Unknown protein [uncultured Sulfurovum sp.]